MQLKILTKVLKQTFLYQLVIQNDEFDILAGVLQGDNLAPCMFIIVIDYCLRSAIEGKEGKTRLPI